MRTHQTDRTAVDVIARFIHRDRGGDIYHQARSLIADLAAAGLQVVAIEPAEPEVQPARHDRRDRPEDVARRHEATLTTGIALYEERAAYDRAAGRLEQAEAADAAAEDYRRSLAAHRAGRCCAV